eukprot:5971300-Prymnesium_polylepis.1
MRRRLGLCPTPLLLTLSLTLRVACAQVVTVVTPFLTDMFADVTPRTNPTAFFLLLPTLAFAVRCPPAIPAWPARR